jgi:hypothetical protein
MTLDMFAIYNIIGNPPLNLTDTVLIEYFPKVSADDVKVGNITRYFARQANHSDGFITEISKDDYNRFRLNSVYKVISMSWKISGPLDDTERTLPTGEKFLTVTGVKTANKLSLNMANEELPGMNNRIHNLAQLYKG